MWEWLLTGCGLPLEAGRNTKARHIQLHRSSQIVHKTAIERTNCSSPTVLQGEGRQKRFPWPQAAWWSSLKGMLFAFAPSVHTLVCFWEFQVIFAMQIKQHMCQLMVRCIHASCTKYMGNLSVWSLWTLFDTGSLSISRNVRLCFNERLWKLWFVWIGVFLYLIWTKIHRRWQR